jgi:hypothetical protein
MIAGVESAFTLRRSLVVVHAIATGMPLLENFFSISLEVLRFDHICIERILDNYAILAADLVLWREPRRSRCEDP